MAAAIFEALSTLRFAIETETDADSPDNETTYKAIRGAIEALFKICFSDGFTGTASTNPPNDTTGILTHAGAAQSVDEHNGRTLVITSGLARGNFYTIDDTAAQTITCTGDNLYSDGVRSGDYFEIFYDIKTNADGHDHDGVNSKPSVGVDAAAITQAELKTTDAEVSVDVNYQNTDTAQLAAGDYAFFPTFKGETTEIDFTGFINESITTSYTELRVKFYNNSTDTPRFGYANQKYIQASGEVHWIFLMLKKTGSIKRPYKTFSAADHPCYGKGLIEHPFGNTFDPKLHDIVVINPSRAECKKIVAGKIPSEKGGYLTLTDIESGVGVDYDRPERSFLEVFLEMFEIQESKEATWPGEPITVALPKIHDGKIVSDWRFMPYGTIIKPIKRIIKKPNYITPLKIKEKRAAKN